MGVYPELNNLDLRSLATQLQDASDKLERNVIPTQPHLASQVKKALWQRLVNLFHVPAPDGDEFAFSYYSEVALLMRQHGDRGVRFLHSESSQTNTVRLRAILFALAEPPKLRRSWLPQLWRSYLQDARPAIVAEAIDGLWRYGDKEVKYDVSQLQKHQSEYVRGSALRYVSHTTPQCVPLLLIGALNDEHFIVRETAIDELDRLEAVDALAYLPRLMEDHSLQVREAARTAVENLTATVDGGSHNQRRAG